MSYPRSITLLVLSPGQSTPTPHTLNASSVLDELSQLQQLVGGYVESLTVGEQVLLLFAEEGKARGEERNELATAAARRAGVADSDWVSGVAAVVGVDGDGQFTDAPPWPLG